MMIPGWLALVVILFIALAITSMLSNSLLYSHLVIKKSQLPSYQKAASRIGCRLSIHRKYTGVANILVDDDEVCLRYANSFHLDLTRLARGYERQRQLTNFSATFLPLTLAEIGSLEQLDSRVAEIRTETSEAP